MIQDYNHVIVARRPILFDIIVLTTFINNGFNIISDLHGQKDRITGRTCTIYQPGK